MLKKINRQARTFIIGYGNPFRRDDGLGPYVAGLLERRLVKTGNIRIFVADQLEALGLSELGGAEQIIFIDATIACIEGGWAWRRIEPQTTVSAIYTHSFSPAFMLGLLNTLYGQNPIGWLVSVQGETFGTGERLSTAAKKRAWRAAADIAFHLDSQLQSGIDHGPFTGRKT